MLRRTLIGLAATVGTVSALLFAAPASAAPASAGPARRPVIGVTVPTRPPAIGVVAHRGGAGLWPQNSAQAFDRAIRAGYPVLETDVRTTSDAVPVLAHDHAVWRHCTGGFAGSPIHDLTWRQLAKVRCDGTPYLRLAALVRRLTRHDARRTVLFAETKERGITNLVRRTTVPIGNRLMLQSFNPADLSPATRNCLLGGDLADAYSRPWVGCVGLPVKLATPARVHDIHVHRRVVWVYVVDSAAQIRTLACGPTRVDAVITNRPDIATATTCRSPMRPVARHRYKRRF